MIRPAPPLQVGGDLPAGVPNDGSGQRAASTVGGSWGEHRSPIPERQRRAKLVLSGERRSGCYAPGRARQSPDAMNMVSNPRSRFVMTTSHQGPR